MTTGRLLLGGLVVTWLLASCSLPTTGVASLKNTIAVRSTEGTVRSFDLVSGSLQWCLDLETPLD